ncbi:vacuolar-type H+-ATPase subunit I/STV1 [Desulfitispora alkaliphila]|uniref:capsid assembly scaffolding protein Gp46 family protein n=1 Tax=Desulfitispora alkaliphila TaxID=622674 RepID=UPI003D209974
MEKVKFNEVNKINLQLFAEGNDDSDDVGTGEDAQDTNNQDDNGDNNDNSDKDTDNNSDFDINSILENEDFQKHIQKLTDKRVSDAVKKRDKVWKEKLKEETKKTEMTQEEILQQKERELADRELKLEKISLFKEKEWDLDLVDYVSGEDIDEIEEKAEKMLEVINKVAEKKVKERLDNSAYTPPTSKTQSKGVTKEDFEKMTYQQRVDLKKTNPELYEKLSK